MDKNIFKLIGAIGLILISVGLLLKNRKHQNTLYIIGGVCLEIYSIHIKDTIFIVLQIIFIFAAFYDLVKN
ncbi:hypothetical protein KKG24_03345 [Patescibacteria group bacterium]|nr:hypothetical protein [Patescibacteria group bacterium]